MDYSWDRAEVRFEACFDSLFVIFFPDLTIIGLYIALSFLFIAKYMIHEHPKQEGSIKAYLNLDNIV